MKTILLLLFAAISINAYAQRKPAEKFYLWDANFKPVNKQGAATYFTSVLKVNDTTWQWDTYNMAGPIVVSEQFKDEEGKQMHGRVIQYHRNGYIDSTGKIINGRHDGDWYFYNDSGKVIYRKSYEAGKLANTRDYLKEQANKVPGDTATTFTIVEIESEFKGGINQWIKYMQKNLVYPERAIQLKKQGSVMVQFIVDKDGSVSDVEVFKSVEFSLDREALRMIRQSPKWQPALQNGKPVKSYKRQPIGFRMQA
jgi:periplasmic protein TonB